MVARVLAGLLVLIILSAGRPAAQAAIHAPAINAEAAVAYCDATHSCEGQQSRHDLDCCAMGICAADAGVLPSAPFSLAVQAAVPAPYGLVLARVPTGVTSSPGLHPPDQVI